MLGDGEFVGENLDIHCTQGVGIAAEGLSVFRLRNTTLAGTITHADIHDLAFPLSGAQEPIMGLALANVGDASLTSVSILGFGGFGCVLLDTAAVWAGGTISDLVGVGLMLDTASLVADDLTIEDIWAGEIGSVISAFGIAAVRDSSLTSTGMNVRTIDGIAVAQLASFASHTGLTLTDNRAGYRMEDCVGDGARPSLKMDGTNLLERNGIAALLLLDSGDIELGGLHASDAVARQVAVSEMGLAEMADGIQIARPVGNIRLEDLTLEGNARVGLLLSGAPPAGSEVTVQRVFVSDDEGFGVATQEGFPSLAQGTVSYGDDSQRVRDEERTAPLPTVGGTDTTPEVASLRTTGLIGAEGLVDVDGRLGSTSVVGREGLGS